MDYSHLTPEQRAVYEQATVLANTIAERQRDDPLRTWEPTSAQQPFINAVLHGEKAENWFMAANRAGKCITPWTRVETADGVRRIVELIGEEGFDVLSWDGESQCTRRASSVFLKSIQPAFRFHLDNGLTFEATGNHRVLTDAGWASLDMLLSTRGDPRCLETFSGSLASCGMDNRRYGQLLHQLASICRASLRRPIDAPVQHRGSIVPQGASEPRQEYIHVYPGRALLARPDDPALLVGLCDLWTDQGLASADQSLSYQHQGVRQSGAVSALVEPEAVNQEAPIVACDIPLFGELRLIGYQELGLQPIVDFEVEDTHCYYAAGVVHHNSDAGAFVGATLARYGEPNPQWQEQGGGLAVKDRATAGWVAGIDFPTLRDVLQPKYFDNGNVPPGATHGPFIPPREIQRWSPGENTLKLKNGSLIAFKSYDSGRTKFQGAERDWIHFDEEPPQGIYEECSIRIGAGRLRILGTCTLLPPEGQLGGVSWMFADLIQPWQEGRLPGINIFTASIYSNHHLNQDVIRQMEAKYPEGSAQRRIRLDGELLPGMAGARAFPGFDRRIHVAEQPPLNPYKPIAWCWDFNVEPFITTVGQRDGMMFRYYDEICLDEGSIPEMCQEFYERYPRHGAEILIYGDATGGARTAQTRASSYRLIFQHMQQYGLPLRMKVPEANPPVIERLDAANNALKGPEDQINVSVDPRCRELIADFEGVLLDNSGKIKKTSNRKDPYAKRTHAIDGATYWIAYEMPIQVTDPMRRQRPSAGIRNPGYRFSKDK